LGFKIQKIRLFPLVTYTGNTLKFEYLGRSTPRAANILTLLYWRWELSFDVKISSLFTQQYKHLHCKKIR
jgi:hypothetical protein